LNYMLKPTATMLSGVRIDEFSFTPSVCTIRATPTDGSNDFVVHPDEHY